MLAPSKTAIDSAERRIAPLLRDFHAALQRGEAAAHELSNDIIPHVVAILHNTGLGALSAAKRRDKSRVLDELAGDPIEQGIVNGVDPFPRAISTPANITQIQKIISDARKSGRRVRVVGAAHSRPKEAISDESPDVVLLSLSKYRGVTIDAQEKLAFVKGGTNMGQDPENPDSTVENSLCDILDQAGWAFPETGGVSGVTSFSIRLFASAPRFMLRCAMQAASQRIPRMRFANFFILHCAAL